MYEYTYIHESTIVVASSPLDGFDLNGSHLQNTTEVLAQKSLIFVRHRRDQIWGCFEKKYGVFNEKIIGKDPLVICYIAIENGPFIVDVPIKNGDFQLLC